MIEEKNKKQFSSKTPETPLYTKPNQALKAMNK